MLICTSVLDCGVNIHDPALKHIVIFSDNRTAVMQMIGRKRLEEGEQITVWIQDLSNASANARRNRCKDLLKYEEEYDSLSHDQRFSFYNSLMHGDSSDKTRQLFSCDRSGIYKNCLAFLVLKYRLDFYEAILGGETTFRTEVENWFCKEHSPLAGELDEFYEAYGETDLDEELQSTLRKIITDMYRRAGKSEKQPTRADKLKHQALNNRLRELKQPYRIILSDKLWILTTNFEEEEVTDNES